MKQKCWNQTNIDVAMDDIRFQIWQYPNRTNLLILNMSYRFYFSVFILLFSNTVFAADVIKKSSSGLCHDSQSQWYSKTTHFTAYSSMEKCLASGGKAYRGYGSSSRKTESLGYSRKLFPHWLDEDNDCQDTRAEVLIKQSSKPVTFKTSKQCQVVAGVWYDPYTGNIYQSDDDLDIDHIIPLKWAYDHGADTWTEYARAAFANTSENTIAVSLSANRSKGDRGPTEWLPPHHAYRCHYLRRWNFLIDRYWLKMTPAENRIFSRQLDACH